MIATECGSAVRQKRFLNFFFLVLPRREFTIHPIANPNKVATIIHTMIWLPT